jgi:hypothetical protein
VAISGCTYRCYGPGRYTQSVRRQKTPQAHAGRMSDKGEISGDIPPGLWSAPPPPVNHPAGQPPPAAS